MFRIARASSAVMLGLFVAAFATAATAQCAFEHPKKANKLQGNLVQTFQYCGVKGFNDDRIPNTTSEGNVPACEPPQTFNESSGSPPNGWLWDETKGQGQVQLKASKTPLVFPPDDAKNPPGDTTDVAIKLKVKGIMYAGFTPAGPATGNFGFVARVTLDDRAGGDMTIVDFPGSVPVPVTDGKINVKSSADAILNLANHPGFPHCSNIEVVYVGLMDENGTSFAALGVFLP